MRKTRPGGKETLLHSNAPLGAIRTDDRLKELKILEGNRIAFCGRGSNSLSSLLRLSVKKNAIRFYRSTELCRCPGQLAPLSVTGSKSALLPLKTRNVARGITVILSPNVSHQSSVTRYPTDNRS